MNRYLLSRVTSSVQGHVGRRHLMSQHRLRSTTQRIGRHHYRAFCSVQAEQPKQEKQEPPVGKTTTPSEEDYSFQAETSKLLDIVTNSIYTDKEVFLRELVSNAADALEKFRHLQTAEEKVVAGDRALEINITADKEKHYITIEDSGIGMTKKEMMANLGTIAKSGSKAFVEAQKSTDAAKNMIGQFGVGFYSAFMVGKEVEVYSKSSVATDEPAHCWVSKGHDNFKIREAPEFTEYGTKIVIHLKDEVKDEYNASEYLKHIITRYSNYVSFPIKVNGEKANSVSAVWLRNKNDITDEEYKEFYKFVSKGVPGDFTYHLHFSTDVPIDLKALLFVPPSHPEKYGMGRMKPNISLYSRKVLLEANSEKLLPNWLRFVVGVVDSEDLPLNLSRESMQDSRLLLNIKKALTKRVIKMLADAAKKDPKKYNDTFMYEFAVYLKEGVCTDFENQKDVAKLLRFSSSGLGDSELTSLDEYISRCEPWQKEIYYMQVPTREVGEASAYYEVFKRKGVEVLFLYNSIDELAMSSLREYGGRKLVSAESGDIDLSGAGDKELEKSSDGKKETSIVKMEKVEIDALTTWMQQTLKDVAHKVTESDRMRDSPAIVVGHESASVRRLAGMVQMDQHGQDLPIPQQHLQVNSSHPIMHRLNELRKSDPQLADKVARQVFDNALVATGLVSDPRTIVPRLNKVLEALLMKTN